MSPPAGKSSGPRFGVFEVDLQEAELRKSGIRIKLQEQPFQILTMLLERPGQTVTREELRVKLWPADTFVDFEHSLNSSINKLREALGDHSENPRFIETLHRRGYRFIAPVNCPSEPTPVPIRRRSRLVLVASLVSIATLATASYFYFHRAPKLLDKDTISIYTINAPGAGKAVKQGTGALFINRAEKIVGWYKDANNVVHGFVRTPDGFFNIVDNPNAAKVSVAATDYWMYGTYVFGIDLKGNIAGQYLDSNSLFRGFVSSPPYTTFTTIDIPGEGTLTGSGGGSNTACISDVGTIAGYVTNDTLVWITGYIRQPDGAITTFRPPGAGTVQTAGVWMNQWGGNCINDEGAITGWVTDNNLISHGYVRHPDGSFTMFDAPGAGTGDSQGTFSKAINEEGAIVGSFIGANSAFHGFLRHPNGSFKTIDAPGAGTGSGQGTFPSGINQNGSITGSYVGADGVYHGFVLYSTSPS